MTNIVDFAVVQGYQRTKDKQRAYEHCKAVSALIDVLADSYFKGERRALVCAMLDQLMAEQLQMGIPPDLLKQKIDDLAVILQ